MVSVVNLVKETWSFAWRCLACWCGFVHAGSASGIPVSRSLAAIIVARHRSMLAARRCRCSIGIYDHFSLRAWRSSPRFRGGLSLLVHGPIHPKCDLWGCSLAILQAALSWWCCPAEGNQGLPEQGKVWRYCLDIGSCPRNATWQTALKCFTKYPCRAHQWGICQGAQEAIWHHYEKLRRHVLNHHQLGPYKPGTFAASAHQVHVDDIP